MYNTTIKKTDGFCADRLGARKRSPIGEAAARRLAHGYCLFCGKREGIEEFGRLAKTILGIVWRAFFCS